MQRELLWFKEVEKIVYPSIVQEKNKEGKTPRELFTKEHEKLRETGEKWMKDTTTSCMVVATLIATGVFAAAFTPPGGNKEETGTPILRFRMLLDLYIHDYMVTNNMHKVADIFAREAEVIPNADAINPPKEFLTDWWSLFWDVYSARTGTARHPETLGASSSKDTQTTQNVPTNVNPTIPSPDLFHMLHEDFNERNKGEQIPFQEELPSTQFATTEAVLQRDFTPNLAVQTLGKLELSVSRNSTNSGNPILIDDSLKSKNLQVQKCLN